MEGLDAISFICSAERFEIPLGSTNEELTRLGGLNDRIWTRTPPEDIADQMCEDFLI